MFGDPHEAGNPHATEYPFLCQIGDRLKSSTKKIRETAHNAKCAGNEHVGPLPYRITCCIGPVTGLATQVPLNKLEKIVV